MDSKLTVCVSGGSGFIGQSLVKLLVEKEEIGRVYVVDTVQPEFKHPKVVWKLADLRVEAPIIDEKVSVIFALAALIGGIRYFSNHPAEILSENAKIMATTLEWSRKMLGQPFICYVSSSMVYEGAQTIPLKEDMTSYIPAPESAYGFSKFVGEKMLEAYADQYKQEYVVIRPFNAYGTESPKEEGVSHVIPDLIRKILQGQGTKQRPLRLIGSGTQHRNFTHVEDIVEGIWKATLNTYIYQQSVMVHTMHPKNIAYNISSPDSISIIHLAQKIWLLIKGPDALPLHYETTPAPMHDVSVRIPCTRRANKYLKWKATRTLDQELPGIIEWVKNYLNPPPISLKEIQDTLTAEVVSIPSIKAVSCR